MEFMVVVFTLLFLGWRLQKVENIVKELQEQINKTIIKTKGGLENVY